MGLFKRGVIWWYEFQFRGARIRDSSYSRDRNVAGRIERARRQELELGRVGLEAIGKPISVAKAFAELITLRTPNRGKKTLEMHENSWAHLAPRFGKLLLQDVRPAHISKHQAQRKEEGASGRSINIEIATLRLVLIHYDRWKYIVKDVHMLPERTDVGRAVEPDGKSRLLKAAKKSQSRSLYPALLLSFHTGVRKKEERMLQWLEVDFRKKEIRIDKSKTPEGEGRVIPLSRTAFACLTKWRSLFPNAKPEHYVFPTERYKLVGRSGAKPGTVQVYACDPTKPMGSWNRSWTTCRRNAGVSCRWHDGRHTFISDMGENHVSEPTLMGMTGHLSRKVLERYSHTRMDLKRKAVSTLDAKKPKKSTPTRPATKQKTKKI